VARYEHSDDVLRVAFSVNGRFVFSGGLDKKISQWEIPDDLLTTARGDPLPGRLKTETTISNSPHKHQRQAGAARGKQKNLKNHIDKEIPDQRRNMADRRIDRSRREITHSEHQYSADADSPSSTGLHGVKDFFNRMLPSSDAKGKQKERRAEREAPELVDVPLGQATYGDYVASEEDGRRPYALLFCLNWFQKKEKKPDLPPQIYDVDLMQAEQEVDLLDVPIPTTRARITITRQEDTGLTSMASQSQPEAGPSCLPDNKGYPEAQSYVVSSLKPYSPCSVILHTT